MSDRRVTFWVQYNEGKPMLAFELTRILHDVHRFDCPYQYHKSLAELDEYMESIQMDDFEGLRYDAFSTQYLNTLPVGKTCRQSLDGPDLIVLAVPAGPSQRLKTLVKVYDTSTHKTRNILGTSTVYVTRGQA